MRSCFTHRAWEEYEAGGGQSGQTSFGKGHDFSRAKNREGVAASAAAVGFKLKLTPAGKAGDSIVAVA